MICPFCGAGNREGASYCDACGGSMNAGKALAAPIPHFPDNEGEDAPDYPDREGNGLLGSGGLVGSMAFDWTARFVAVGFIGFAAGIWALSQGIYGFAAFFILLGIVGVVGTYFMLSRE